jgi:hypothetical protein
MCEQQYFFDYVLGYRSPSNKKADKGTIVHKILEILAFVQFTKQKGEKTFTDDIVGEVDVNDYDLTELSTQVYDYYTSNFDHHEWSEKDKKDCFKWAHKAITYADGMFDPRNRDILYPEQQFDITIDKPWAKYDYGNLKGTLAMKGTIDLITRVNDDTLEIIDWKTGRRLNWATGEEKTQEKLEKDPQLMIYFYAAQKLYPEIKHCIVTIYFINDGGPFSMTFDKSDIIATENLLRTKFEKIKKCKKPQLSKSWKCKKLCHYGKNSFNGTNVTPMIEYREGKLCEQGEFMTMCEQVKHDVEMNGIDSVVDDYTVPGYHVGYYQAPGSTD